jgi:hypothetical protein
LEDIVIDSARCSARCQCHSTRDERGTAYAYPESLGGRTTYKTLDDISEAKTYATDA